MLTRRKILLKKVVFVPISCRNAFNMVATTMRDSTTFGQVEHEQHGVKTLITTMRGYKQFSFRLFKGVLKSFVSKIYIYFYLFIDKKKKINYKY